MRCVSYTRVSSEDFMETKYPVDTIGRQNEKIQQYAEEHSLRIRKRYCDRNSESDAQAAFQEMLNDGVEGKYDCVIICNVNRCGPNMFFARQLFLETLFPLGIHFAVVEDDYDSFGKTKKDIEDYFAEKTNDRLSILRQWQEKLSKERGRLRFRDNHYGYRVSDDRSTLVLDEVSSAVIREIFLRAAAGEALGRVVDDLNNRGIPSPMKYKILHSINGKKGQFDEVWRKSSVVKLIQNPIYKGEWIRPMSGGQQLCRIEPIVDEETFQKANANNPVKEYRKRAQANTPRHIFSRMIFDKKTGKKLYCVHNCCDGSGTVFTLKEQKPDRFDKKVDKYISMEKVTAAVKTAINKEIQHAMCAKRRLEDGDTEKKFRIAADYKLAELRSLTAQEDELIQLKIILQRMEIDGDELMQRFHEIDGRIYELENEVSTVSKELKMIKNSFSRKNTWVLKYADLKIPEKLSREFIRKYVSKVIVEGLEDVRVSLHGLEQKQYLPQEWMEG